MLSVLKVLVQQIDVPAVRRSVHCATGLLRAGRHGARLKVLKDTSTVTLRSTATF